jgi:hypoxanthine phosphoribosyltransferase
MDPNDRLGRILFDEETIAHEVARLARRIDADYEQSPGELVLLGVLKGAVYFLTDLSRRLKTPHTIDTVAAKSYYGATRSSGDVRIVKAPDMNLAGKHVLVVEDIYDTGLTLVRLLDHLRELSPASLEVCALFSKRKAREHKTDIKYVGAEIPDLFIVGYGLDYDELYRNLPYVAVFVEKDSEDAGAE